MHLGISLVLPSNCELNVLIIHTNANGDGFVSADELSVDSTHGCKSICSKDTGCILTDEYVIS